MSSDGIRKVDGAGGADDLPERGLLNKTGAEPGEFQRVLAQQENTEFFARFTLLQTDEERINAMLAAGILVPFYQLHLIDQQRIKKAVSDEIDSLQNSGEAGTGSDAHDRKRRRQQLQELLDSLDEKKERLHK